MQGHVASTLAQLRSAGFSVLGTVRGFKMSILLPVGIPSLQHHPPENPLGQSVGGPTGCCRAVACQQVHFSKFKHDPCTFLSETTAACCCPLCPPGPWSGHTWKTLATAPRTLSRHPSPQPAQKLTQKGRAPWSPVQRIYLH